MALIFVAVDFVLSDSSVNRYGFRILTSGARLKALRDNPVLLYMHDRQQMVIGKWNNIRVEGDKLLASPEFDEDDELAMKVKKKVEKGYLRAASVSLDVVSISDDPKLMLKGQTRATVTEWEPYEASIVDIPGNKNALKLSNAEGLTLAANAPEEYIDLMIPKIEKSDDMNKIALALGLKEDATEQEVLQAIASLAAKGAEKPASQKEQKPTTTAANDEMQATILSLGKKSGLITDDNEAHYQKLIATDPQTVLNIINAHQGDGQADEKKDGKGDKDFSLAALMKELGKQGQSEPKELTWDDYQEKDPQALVQLKFEKPDEFKRLYKDKYGVEPAL